MVTGKHCYGSLLFPLRLEESDPGCSFLQSIQTVVNDTARVLLGVSPSDRITVEELLASSGLTSLNRSAIKATVTELWKCLNCCDGPNGTKNTLGM